MDILVGSCGSVVKSEQRKKEDSQQVVNLTSVDSILSEKGETCTKSPAFIIVQHDDAMPEWGARPYPNFYASVFYPRIFFASVED